MAVIAGAIAALGTIVSAYAAYQSGQQQAKALDYQAKVARNQATAAQQAAQVAAENARERNRRVLASHRARIGASGANGDGRDMKIPIVLAQAEIPASVPAAAPATGFGAGAFEAIGRGGQALQRVGELL